MGVLTLLGGVAALVIGHLGGSAPSLSPSHSPRYITCAYAGTLGGAGVDRGYCDRFAGDVVRRTDLTQEQRDRLKADADKAQRAVRVPAFCADVLRQAPSGRFPECAGLPTSPVRNRALPGGSAPAAPGDSQPRPADAEAIRLALERAGFPGATVRVAREDDPAPHGTIVFGVPIAEACLVGYEAVPGGGGGYSLQGKLPDGRCLSA